MFAALKARYDAFSERVLASLSEIEREDVKSFDRWFYSGDGWRWLVGIIAATTLFAWLASQLPWNMSFLEAAVLFNVVMLMLLWAGLTAWFGYRKFSGKLFRYIVIGPLLALVGAFVGAGVAGLVKGVDPLAWLQDSAKVRHVVIAGLVFGTLYSLVVALIAALRNREYRALAAHLEAERRQSDLSRQLAESKLRMLQLQIEPHFLFNTLGSAQQLAERGAPEAARLISNLIRFLRAATPSLRNEATTLAQEAALIEAYLEIMKRRLGVRLDYGVWVPDELRGTALPPGMLITLVENAIKHGIELSPDGGRIDVRAERGPPGMLVLTVADTGAGLDNGPQPGQGIGLANIRERLALLFGDAASLELEGNEPRGFVARIRLPVPGVRARSGEPGGGHPMTARPTALIAEDEPLMRERLKETLAQVWPELEIVAEASDGDEALALFDAHAPSIAFLDIRMPGRTGLEVAAAIGGDCHVVFITAYDQYALAAFEAGAVDYLLKPVEADRLAQTVDRVQRKLAAPPADLSALLAELRGSVQRPSQRLRWIKAAVGKQVKLIAVGDVIYFQSDAKYTRVVLAQSEALIRTPLKDLLDDLDPDKFWQVHRSTVVNLDQVAGVLREDAERQFVLLEEPVGAAADLEAVHASVQADVIDREK